MGHPNRLLAGRGAPQAWALATVAQRLELKAAPNASRHEPVKRWGIATFMGMVSQGAGQGDLASG